MLHVTDNGIVLNIWRDIESESDKDRRVYRFELLLPDGKSLFTGAQWYVITPNYSDASERALSTAFVAVTMQLGDKDSDYFDVYTQDEIAWRDSESCRLFHANLYHIFED